MFKILCNIIDKFLFPSRFTRGLSCNDGLLFIPAILAALSSIGGAIGAGAGAIGSAIGAGAGAIGSAAGAIGSGVGSVASAIGSGIGSALGIGGGSAAAGTAGSAIGGVTGGSSIAALPTAAEVLGSAGVGTGIGAAAPIGTTATAMAAPTTSLLAGTGGVSGGLAGLTGTGTTLGTALPGITGTGIAGLPTTAEITAGLPTVKASEGLLKTLGVTLSKEILGLDPEASMKENASNMAVKQVSNTMNKKEAPAPVNIDNSFQGKSPNIVQSKTSSGAQSIPPEMMQKLLQMMADNKRTGRTTPIGSSIFSGGR